MKRGGNRLIEWAGSWWGKKKKIKVNTPQKLRGKQTARKEKGNVEMNLKLR